MTPGGSGFVTEGHGIDTDLPGESQPVSTHGALTGVPDIPAQLDALVRPDVRQPAIDFGPDGLDRRLRDTAPRDRRRLTLAAVLLVDLCALLLLPVVLLPGPAAAAVWYPVVALVLLALGGAYRPRITLSVLDQAPRFVSRLGIAFLLVAPFTISGGSDVVLVRAALISIPAFVVGRGLSYAVIRWARRRRLVENPTLILGGGRLGMDLLMTLYEHPEYGLRPVGFLDSGPQLDHRQPLGPMTSMEHVLDRYGVRNVIVAFGTTREAELVALVRNTAMRDVDIYVVPRFFDVGMAPSGPDVDDVWGVPLYRVRRAALSRGVWPVKRLVDIVVAGTALVILAPLIGAIALAVKVGSPGPVLFRQPRTGQFGRDIDILKFRSLRMPAPADEAAPPEGGGSGAETTETASTMLARREDVERRQTRVGSFLRRTSLDEVPQLWNILRGDMSLVGPRPEERRYAVQFGESVHGYRDRHRLAVGLSGWAQVHGLRGDTSIEERARFDNHYIEHWSLWRDLIILMRTLGAVARDAVSGPRQHP